MTAGQTEQVAWYVARMAKRCIANETVHQGRPGGQGRAGHRASPQAR
ncbi:DUF6257 family protein [Streptomyces sp. NBC_00233]|nr:DUF6257 family protein [Streptomyces sp. NBC_00233]MCX5233027.1 DUF6257 family protein [Streptomyces sp. NBC_00233]